MQMTIAKDMNSLQQALLPLAKAGKRIALVPTMGALHAGHIALMQEARQYADTVIATVFVNPKQFGPSEDFDKYPRRLETDVQKLNEASVGLLYAPSIDDMYPPGFITKISPGALGDVLEGAFRPGFFDGVSTVVTKLFTRILPHVALFGEKDYQQLCIIRRVTYDLDLPVEIIGVPTVREADGLAMSSRNAYLSAEERKIAPKLYGALLQTAARMIGGQVSLSDALAEGTAQLSTAGFKVDYLSLCEAGSLNPLAEFQPPARLLVAAWLGKTRLIDNIGIE